MTPEKWSDQNCHNDMQICICNKVFFKETYSKCRNCMNKLFDEKLKRAIILKRWSDQIDIIICKSMHGNK